jgi:hypothetical protein
MRYIIIAALLLFGCAGPIVMGKPDGDNSQWKRDDYQCRQETAEYAGGSGILGAMAMARAQKNADRNYVTCMEIRGYERKP